jgi:hypothetical protein
MAEKKPCVWVSRGGGNSTDTAVMNVRSEAYSWAPDFLQTFTRTYAQGQWQEPDLFPKKYYLEEEEQRPLPDFFFANVCMVVSERVAAVLEQFNLREGSLVPTKFYKADRTTPIEGKFYSLNWGAQKDVFGAANTGGKPHIYKTDHPFLPGWGNIKDDLVAVTDEALKGAHLWTDVSLLWAIFVSDELRDALKKKELDKAFRFYRCRVEG